MTMHLAHPSLSLNGKKKGKKKFRNAEAAQRARQQQAEWSDLKLRWGAEDDKKKSTKSATKSYVPPAHPNFKKRDHVQATDPAKFIQVIKSLALELCTNLMLFQFSVRKKQLIYPVCVVSFK